MATTKQSEAQIQQLICCLLEWLKVAYSLTDASRSWSKNGHVTRSKVRRSWPDITGCLPEGRFFAFEVKTPKGRISEGQTAMIAKLRNAGAYVDVVRSLDDAVFALRNWLPTGSDAAKRLERLRIQ